MKVRKAVVFLKNGTSDFCESAANLLEGVYDYLFLPEDTTLDISEVDIINIAPPSEGAEGEEREDMDDVELGGFAETPPRSLPRSLGERVKGLFGGGGG